MGTEGLGAGPAGLVGLVGTAELVVQDAHTALALGSGDLPVLGTPALLALCEAATVAAFSRHLADEVTSVGTSVRLEHVAASAVGARVVAEATVAAVAGQRVTLVVVAREGERLVGQGKVERAIVDRGSFVDRLARRRS